MKRILSLMMVLALMLTCLFLTACDQEEDVTIIRSFLAGYSQDEVEGRVLLNLKSDNTLEMYYLSVETGMTVATTGTYTLGENEEFDETISLAISGKTIDATLIDSIFEAEIPDLGLAAGQTLSFYETSPVSMDGDVYVGYLAKTGGMGAMVYAYALTLRDDGTFDVSIMQMATVMHVWDKSVGTYVTDGDKITFTYDAMDGEGAVATEDFVSEGTVISATELSVGFNIAQTAVRASNATFILTYSAPKN